MPPNNVCSWNLVAASAVHSFPWICTQDMQLVHQQTMAHPLHGWIIEPMHGHLLLVKPFNARALLQ